MERETPLLDTQLLLWAAGQPKRLSQAARKLLNDPQNELWFSTASQWEIAIKSTLGREISASSRACCAGGCSTTVTSSFPSPASMR